MKALFITADGLMAMEECPQIEEVTKQIMRPLWHHPPNCVPAKTGYEHFREYRAYVATGEQVQGVAVYRELATGTP